MPWGALETIETILRMRYEACLERRKNIGDDDCMEFAREG